MKMGIERVLRENFQALGEVISEPLEGTAGENDNLSVQKVVDAIQKVLPAIKSLGGSVTITRVDGTTKTVFVDYKGPEKLIKGLTLIIKELPDVERVEISQI
jgi:Fe-S cluster biogenesis protein NfuA